MFKLINTFLIVRYDVVVDDYLPTNEEGELIYCHNKIDKNEFFGPLLEKAFAKLFGCYEFLDGGSPSSAMTDFTGAICENFNLAECAKLTYGDDEDEDEDDDDNEEDENDDDDDDDDDEDDDDDDDDEEEDENSEDDDDGENDEEKTNDNATDLDRLWIFITKSLKMNSMMNASFYDPEQKGTVEELQENGLYAGHAYSLVQAVELKYKAKNKKDKKVSLLKLRNPHGCDKPWNGPWSIESKDWKKLDKKTKQKFKLTLDNYGEFFMSFDDFISNFQELNVAHVNMDAYFDPDEEDDEEDEEFSKGNKEWKELKFSGEWLPGKNAGANESFWNNTQYLIKVDKSKDISPVVISLMQPYLIKMKMDGKDFESIKISVYHVESSQSDIKRKISSKTRFNEDDLTLFDSTGVYFGDREIARRFNLDSGYYVAIASNLEDNFNGKFLLRFFHDKKSVTISELKN